MSVIDNVIRRKQPHSEADIHGTGNSRRAVRLSGTSIDQETDINKTNPDGPIDADKPYGRTGNDWTYPDYPRGRFDVETVNGDRLQDFANTHLSEGPAPGRIPRGWNNRLIGKVGRDITGNPSGDDYPPITVTGQSAGGIGDMQYIPHTPTPRNTTIARPYLRTVDDAAQIPGVFVADPTRR